MLEKKRPTGANCGPDGDTNSEVHLQYTTKFDVSRALEMMHRYCCARCWGHLICVDQEVICAGQHYERCNGGRYFVTKRWAEHQRAASALELWQVKQNYPDLVPVVKKSMAELMAELGY